MPPKKQRVVRINGRKVEKKVFNAIRSEKPNWFMFRFNENRHNATPADFYISNSKLNIMLEVKATMKGVISKGNIRKNQIESLRSFQDINKNNLSVIVLYFSNRVVLVNVNSFSKLKSYIKFNDVKEVGVEILDWKKIGYYFDKLIKHKTDK